MNTETTIKTPTHRDSGRGWTKTVTGIDRTQRGGYMLQGEFLNQGREATLPVGTVIVAVGQNYSKSVKSKCKAFVDIYRVGEDGLEKIASQDFQGTGASVSGAPAFDKWAGWTADQIEAL